MDWVKNNKKKNLLNMIELLEKRGYTLAELSEKLMVTKQATRGYITSLKKLKVNVVVIKAKPSIIAIIDKKNIEKVKEKLAKEINFDCIEIPRGKLDKSSNEYIKYLLRRCNFHKITKAEAIRFVTARSKASKYDIYKTYAEVRQEYLKNMVY